MKSSKVINLGLLELILRIIIACCVLYYGISKVTQFEGAKIVHSTVREASNFEMMWAFFGTTKEYPIFIGCIQAIGAILLVFRKTKLLAALLLTPVFLNIIILDILYEVPYAALTIAIVIQSVLLLIIIQQRKKITEAFQVLLIKNGSATISKSAITRDSIVIIIGIALWFAISMSIGLLRI